METAQRLHVARHRVPLVALRVGEEEVLARVVHARAAAVGVARVGAQVQILHQVGRFLQGPLGQVGHHVLVVRAALRDPTPRLEARLGRRVRRDKLAHLDRLLVRHRLETLAREDALEKLARRAAVAAPLQDGAQVAKGVLEGRVLRLVVANDALVHLGEHVVAAEVGRQEGAQGVHPRRHVVDDARRVLEHVADAVHDVGRRVQVADRLLVLDPVGLDGHLQTLHLVRLGLDGRVHVVPRKVLPVDVALVAHPLDELRQRQRLRRRPRIAVLLDQAQRVRAPRDAVHVRRADGQVLQAPLFVVHRVFGTAAIQVPKKKD